MKRHQQRQVVLKRRCICVLPGMFGIGRHLVRSVSASSFAGFPGRSFGETVLPCPLWVGSFCVKAGGGVLRPSRVVRPSLRFAPRLSGVDGFSVPRDQFAEAGILALAARRRPLRRSARGRKSGKGRTRLAVILGRLRASGRSIELATCVTMAASVGSLGSSPAAGAGADAGKTAAGWPEAATAGAPEVSAAGPPDAPTAGCSDIAPSTGGKPASSVFSAAVSVAGGSTVTGGSSAGRAAGGAITSPATACAASSSARSPSESLPRSIFFSFSRTSSMVLGRDRRKAGIKQGAWVIFVVDAIPAVFGLG